MWPKSQYKNAKFEICNMELRKERGRGRGGQSPSSVTAKIPLKNSNCKNATFWLRLVNLCSHVGNAGEPGGQPLQLQRGSTKASSHRTRNQHGRISKCGNILNRSLGALRAPTSSWGPFGPRLRPSRPLGAQAARPTQVTVNSVLACALWIAC